MSFVGAVQIRAMNTRRDSFIRIVVNANQKSPLDPTRGYNSTYFISYRSRNAQLPYDQGLMNATGEVSEVELQLFTTISYES